MRWARRALATAGAVAGGAALVQAVGAFRFEVRGSSMRPSLEPGDWLLAIRLRRPRRGDLVVLRHPDRGFEVVKRVVGLPGERVGTDGRRVWIGESAIAEPYAHGTGAPGEWEVPAGHVVVLGDDRGHSTDSRSFGPVHLARLSGRAVLRYWPRPGLLGPPGRLSPR